MSADLAGFLLQRIAEDEATARAAAASRDRPWVSAKTVDTPTCRLLGTWDPARVLAECEARRRIVTDFGSWCGGYYKPGTTERAEDEQIATDLGIEYEPHWPEGYHGHCDGCAAAQSADADHGRVLRLLALPYMDHADFDPSWRL